MQETTYALSATHALARNLLAMTAKIEMTSPRRMNELITAHEGRQGGQSGREENNIGGTVVKGTISLLGSGGNMCVYNRVRTCASSSLLLRATRHGMPRQGKPKTKKVPGRVEL